MRARTVALALLLGTPWSAARMTAQAERPTLTGSWEAHFILESWRRLAREPRAREARGTLDFAPVPETPPGAEPARAVHPGRFDVNFQPLGFGTYTNEVLGTYVSPDSVHLILNPDVDHGVIYVDGELAGDSVVGTWRMVGYPSAASGRVSMRRR